MKRYMHCNFLADCTAACTTIGSWHGTVVCLSVCDAVCCWLRVGVGGWNLATPAFGYSGRWLQRANTIFWIYVHRLMQTREEIVYLITVSRGCTVTFSGHFLFISSDKFCCRINRSATTRSEKPDHLNFHIWTNHGWHGHVTMAVLDAAFSAVWFSCYTVHRTQYNRPL